MTETPIGTLAGSIMVELGCACPRCGKGNALQYHHKAAERRFGGTGVP